MKTEDLLNRVLNDLERITFRAKYYGESPDPEALEKLLNETQQDLRYTEKDTED